MGKLYADEPVQELEIGRVVNFEKEFPTEVNTETLDESLDTLEIVTEHFSEVCSKLSNLETISTGLNTKPLASMEYFVTLEGYTPILKNIADGLGVKLHVASLEDFNNTNSTEAAHTVAMEGIGDFIKNLWKKLKDLMSRFFKKVREFFRRLVNANMEIDTYEKYVPAMLSKIKSEKLKLADNASDISSKLPSLLAFEGMTNIDSDFMLTSGVRSLESLTQVLNEQVKFGLKTVANVELVKIRKTLEEIVGLNLSRVDSVQQVQKLTDQLNTSVYTIAKLLAPVPYNANDLPEDAYETLSMSLMNSRLSDLYVTGLTDSLDTQFVLPKNFNAFIAIDPKTKVYSTTTSEYKEAVDNHINPIGTVDNLSRLYDFYKKFSKQVNIRELDSTLSDTEKAIDATIKVMATKYADMIERIKLAKSTVTAAMTDDSVKEALKLTLAAIEADEDPYLKIGMNVRSKVNKEVLLAIRAEADFNMILGLIKKHKEEEKFVMLVRSAYEDEGLTSEFDSLVFKVSVLSDEDSRAIIVALDEVQKFVMSFFQALQVLFRGLSGNLVATYTECRYELIRYIYQSARKYA